MRAVLATALGHVADGLVAAGVAATVDARNLNLPGAWVTPADVRGGRLAGYQVDVTVALVAADAGGMDTIRALDLLFEQAQAAFAIASAEPGTVTLDNHGSGPLPALVFTITVDLSPDDDDATSDPQE